MTEEGKSRRKALNDRLKARRRAKEAEVERRGAGERERCDQDADLARLEELEVEVCVYCATRECFRIIHSSCRTTYWLF